MSWLSRQISSELLVVSDGDSMRVGGNASAIFAVILAVSRALR